MARFSYSALRLRAALSRFGQLVADFADSCVLAAAKAVGIDHTRPAFGPQSASHLTLKCCSPGSRTRPTASGHWQIWPKDCGRTYLHMSRGAGRH